MAPRGAIPIGGQQPYQPAPTNAALLIDFDNVTMAIRSDLGKELKALLNSDVIRGKVAVQRAYADWRRYPQYIVPLAESSVDLIFAPAYGSAKKNATDLRMAIDAMELVFTRPEIGTYILMTGDSDFSSCVLKLKEYGKYVIGVGMRESSSDLLIQNCDEYYSYHSLSGLTREGDVQESKEDPWVLVRRAVQQMMKNGDVMRTDRLKQVMLELDPGFDEKSVGYSKFSRFVSEAATKGVIRLRKMENGQYEILPETQGAEAREKVVERIVAEAEAGGNGRRRRGRGGREERPREERPAPAGEVDREPAAARAESEPEATATLPAAEGEESEAVQPATAATAPAGEPIAAPPPAETAVEVRGGAGALNQAYALLQEAVRRLTGREGKAVRDGDVKRKMLELSKDFDESQLGFSKFTRFLRQAHDAEVIDLQRTGAGNYDVTLPAGGRKLPPPAVPVEAAAADPAVVAAVEAPVEAPVASPAAEDRAPARGRRPTPAARAEEPARPGRGAEPPEERAGRPAAEAPRAEPRTVEPAAQPIIAPPAGLGALRGRRGGRLQSEGPPPILPGQVIASPLRDAAIAAAAPDVGEGETPEAPSAREVEPALKSRGRRGRRGRGKTVEVQGDVAEATRAERPASEETAAAGRGEVEPEAPGRARRGRGGRGKAVPDGAETVQTRAGSASPAPARAAAEATRPEEAGAAEATGRTEAGRGRGRGGQVGGRPDTAAPAREARGRGGDAERRPGAAAARGARIGRSAAELGLPRTREEITTYLSNEYKGVGPKTAETLLEKFGIDLFDALESRPAEVQAALGDRRAAALLEQWVDDRARRIAQSTPPGPPASRAGEGRAPRKDSAARRGGSGRPGAKSQSASSPRAAAKSDSGTKRPAPRRGARGGAGRKKEPAGEE
jgi:uncharacterized protein (TIGR00288 family)